MRFGLPVVFRAGSLMILALFPWQVGGAGAPPRYTGDPNRDLALVEQVIAAGPFRPEWESLRKVGIPEWYLDAKFGIFIHWGVYSVPAYGNEWYPRLMYQKDTQRRGLNYYDYHRLHWGPQNVFGYKDFIPLFTAERFDPEAWAQLFVEAGARYVVPVAEHHDGFPMYRCSYTRWDASEMGPKRDVVAEIAAAVRRQGLHFGVSSHRAFNWAYYPRSPEFDTVDPRYFGLYGKPHDYLYGELKNPWPPQSKEFMDDWLCRTAELVDHCQPDLVWFDFCIAPNWFKTPDENPNVEYLKKFAAFYYNRAASWGKTGVINYKHNAFPEDVAVLDIERGKLTDIRPRFWQTDTSVSYSSWGYVRNHRYKTADTIVDDLVDIVSKNGCLLLNIGPKADGTIPEPEIRILREIGAWLRINGEAIYQTRPWKIYGEGPTKVESGPFSEAKAQPFTSADVRFTTRGSVLYAIVLDWPESGKVTIQSLGSGNPDVGKIRRVRLLGYEGEVRWAQNASGLTVEFPPERPCDFAYTLRIER